MSSNPDETAGNFDDDSPWIPESGQDEPTVENSTAPAPSLENSPIADPEIGWESMENISDPSNENPTPESSGGTNLNPIDLSSMTASSLFNNLFTDGRSLGPPPELPLFGSGILGPIAVNLQTIEGRSSPPTLPLFLPDPPNPNPDESSPSSPSPLPPPEPDHLERQAMEEMRVEFQPLAMKILQHAGRGWNTAYRDFADVSVLLSALQKLGIVEGGNRKLCRGEYHASTGVYSIDWKVFVDAMDLGCTPATWGNKITTHSRIMSIGSFARYNGGVSFRSQEYQQAWSVVSRWSSDENQFLPDDDWAAKRYGNTKLQELVRGMSREVLEARVEYGGAGQIE